MSRFLSEALGESEPRFRQAIMALERRSGHPNQDIRLSARILQQLPAKIKALGLDPNDTTNEELYFALNHKLADQDSKLVKKLRTIAAQSVSAEANISDGLTSLATTLKLQPDCFALKSSVLKQQLGINPPKRMMKALHYRSIDSMLKLEPMPLILLAINNFESEAYVSSLYAKYKKFTPANFESRQLAIVNTKDRKWQNVLKDIKARTGLSMVTSYELAAVIMLPIDNEPLPGQTALMLTNLLSEITLIQAVSSYLRLHQVNSNFGTKLKDIVENEPYIDSSLLGHRVSWHTASHILTSSDVNQFAPHLTIEELTPVNLLSKLGYILEDFEYWVDSESLALVKQAEATSLNIRDVAYNLANGLSFNNRQLDHFKHSLINELMKLYISPEQVISSLTTNQQPKYEKVVADNQTQAVYL